MLVALVLPRVLACPRLARGPAIIANQVPIYDSPNVFNHPGNNRVLKVQLEGKHRFQIVFDSTCNTLHLLDPPLGSTVALMFILRAVFWYGIDVGICNGFPKRYDSVLHRHKLRIN